MYRILFLFLLFPLATSQKCPTILPPASLPTTTRIINGLPSPQSTSLYHVSLTSPPLQTATKRFVRRCTGVRLSRLWILTAAHCETTLSWSVSLSGTTTSLGTPAKIASVHTHPNYTSSSLRRFDIALIKLSLDPLPQQIPFYPSLNTDPSLPEAGAFLRVSGYGAIEDHKGASLYTTEHTLHEVDLPALPFEVCEKAYEGTPNLGKTDPDRQLCAGYRTGGCDACMGDSGGPLVQLDGERKPVVVAVVSAAAGCAKNGFPGINVKVAPYLKWMKSIGAVFTKSVPEQKFITEKGVEQIEKANEFDTAINLPLAGMPVLTPPPVTVDEEHKEKEDEETQKKKKKNNEEQRQQPTVVVVVVNPTPPTLPQVTGPPKVTQPGSGLVQPSAGPDLPTVSEPQGNEDTSMGVEDANVEDEIANGGNENASGGRVSVVTQPDEAGVKVGRGVVATVLLIGMTGLFALVVIVFGVAWVRRRRTRQEEMMEEDVEEVDVQVEGEESMEWR